MLRKPPDLLVFTSSSTVENFATILGREGHESAEHGTVAALGPVTAATLATFGKEADVRPGENTIPSLLDEIGRYFQRLPTA